MTQELDILDDEGREGQNLPNPHLQSGQPRDNLRGAARTRRLLEFPFKGKPALPGQKKPLVMEVAPRILWARVPLPWAIDHINVYLFDEGDHWSLVDTGSQGKRGHAHWQSLLKGPLKGKPIKNIVATHLHPDHLGLAGWLAKEFDSQFFMTSGEYLTAQLLWQSAAEDIPQFELDFLFEAGVPRAMEPAIRSIGYQSYKDGVHALPAQYVRLEDGASIKLGGYDFQVVVGRGHSPEHACLFSAEARILVSGDQVLPGISSNVSVYAREPFSNPLAHWISALDRLYHLPAEDILILPSHGRVFKGLKARIDDLITEHSEKLTLLHQNLTEPLSAAAAVPHMFARELSGFEFFLALGETLAHLNYLASLGFLVRRREEGVTLHQATGTVAGFDFRQAASRLPGIGLRRDIF